MYSEIKLPLDKPLIMVMSVLVARIIIVTKDLALYNGVTGTLSVNYFYISKIHIASQNNGINHQYCFLKKQMDM